MPICILVLKDHKKAYSLGKKLQENSLPLLSFDLIEPNLKNQQEGKDNHVMSNPAEEEQPSFPLKKLNINEVKLLNPKLSRRDRQKKMSMWLMPFGFIAGLTFAGMTNLNTFSQLGFGQWAETIFGGLLGMGSGLIGSFFASASVNPYKEDIETLRKFNEKGLWLLLLKTPFEIDIPWNIIKETEPMEVVRIDSL